MININRRFLATFYCGLATVLLLVSRPIFAVESTDSAASTLALSDRSGRLISQGLLLSSDAQMTITGLINKVTVTQRYKNTSSEVLNGRYAFALPDNSAVYEMQMRVGERVIVGEIKEKKQAEQAYEVAKQQGKKASLVSQKRPNLFVSQVANIEAGQTVEVTLVYQQLLHYEQGEFTVRFPMLVAPRYQPKRLVFDADLQGNWPSASEITSAPFIDELETQSAKAVGQGMSDAKIKQSVSIALNLGFELDTIMSPYHEINQQLIGNNHYQVSLKQGTTFANRDFVLRVKPKNQAAIQAAVFKEHFENDDYALVMLMPPSDEFIAAQRLPREVIFVIDTSGSMHGESLEQAKSALFFALANLDPQDSFNIIEFNSKVNALNAQALPANDFNIRRARNFVYGLKADGGTEIGLAFEQVLDNSEHADYLRQIVFLTDGSISNETEVFAQIKGSLGDSRIFTIGIGSAPNSYFMTRAATLGRGTFTFIGDVTDVQRTMKNLFVQLANAALKELIITDENGDALDFWPKPIADLYFNQAMMVAIKLNAGQNQINVRGQQAFGQFNAQFMLGQAQTGSNIARLWARQQIQSLSMQQVNTANKEHDPIADKILTLALKYQLLSPYTSFLAVDKTPSSLQPAHGESRITPMAVKGWSAPIPQTGGQSVWQLLVGFMLLMLAAIGWWRNEQTH